MTIVIDPSWMAVPVLAALIVGTLSLVATVLLLIWAVVLNMIGRARRPMLYGPKLWGGF